MIDSTYEADHALLAITSRQLEELLDKALVDLIDACKACNAFAKDDPHGAVIAALKDHRIVMERLARDLQLKADEIRDCLAE